MKHSICFQKNKHSVGHHHLLQNEREITAQSEKIGSVPISQQTMPNKCISNHLFETREQIQKCEKGECAK